MISIIMPVYNTEKYLRRCIDSILAQTYADFELILIDDGSTDSSGIICDEYAEKDNRIVVIHQENQGQAIARNIGLDYVFEKNNSEWISFVDSDDWIHSRYLEALEEIVLKTGCSVGICAYSKTNGNDSELIYTDSNILTFNPERFFFEHRVTSVVVWGKLYKKSLLTKIRFPKIRLYEDEFFTHLVLFKNKEIAYTEQPLYYYFQNPESATNQSWSPVCLKQIEGILKQSKYLYKHHYYEALELNLKVLLWCITEQYRTLKNTDYYLDYLPTLRRLLRKSLSLARKNNAYPFNKIIYLYELAYPIEMKFYWKKKTIIQKIKGSK